MEVSKEEKLLSNDRPAKRSAELVVAQLRLIGYALRVKAEDAVVNALGPSSRGLVGIQCVIAEELKQIAMVVVGARLDGGAYDSALVNAEFSRSVLRNQVKFLNGIDIWGVSHFVIFVFAVINAVQ